MRRENTYCVGKGRSAPAKVDSRVGDGAGGVFWAGTFGKAPPIRPLEEHKLVEAQQERCTGAFGLEGFASLNPLKSDAKPMKNWHICSFFRDDKKFKHPSS